MFEKIHHAINLVKQLTGNDLVGIRLSSKLYEESRVHISKQTDAMPEMLYGVPVYENNLIEGYVLEYISYFVIVDPRMVNGPIVLKKTDYEINSFGELDRSSLRRSLFLEGTDGKGNKNEC